MATSSPYIQRPASTPFVAQSPASVASPLHSQPNNSHRASLSSQSTANDLEASTSKQASHYIPALSSRSRQLVSQIALPDTASPLPGWSVRWRQYQLLSSASVAVGKPSQLILPSSATAEEDSVKHRLRGALALEPFADFSSIQDWLDSRPSVLDDPFEKARELAESVSARASGDAQNGLPPRLCYIETEKRDGKLDRSFWTFDIAHRPNTLGGTLEGLTRLCPFPRTLPPTKTPEAEVANGMFSYGSLFPSLIDSRTGYPIKFTAKNMPSSVDLSRRGGHPACDNFIKAVQHHIISQLSCSCPKKWISTAHNSALFDNQAIVTIDVAFRWEGLVMTPCLEATSKPSASANTLTQGQQLCLAPLQLQAEYVRPYGRESTETQAQRYSKSAKTRYDVLKEAKHIEETWKLTFAKVLQRPFEGEDWLLCNWEGRQVVWPASLCLTSGPEEQAVEQKPDLSESHIVSLSEIASKTGQYIEDLTRERDRQKNEQVYITSSHPPLQPAKAPVSLEVFTPNSWTESSSPIDILQELKASVQPAGSMYPTPPTQSNEKAQVIPIKLKPSWNEIDLFADDQEERWNRYVRPDPIINDYDAFTGGAITEDDFSFFDEPRTGSTKPASTQSSNPSTNPFAFDLFGGTPNQQASPGSLPSPGTFGDFASPPKPNVFTDSSTTPAGNSFSPGTASLFGASPAAIGSPYKSAVTPFTPQDPLQPLVKMTDCATPEATATPFKMSTPPSSFTPLDLSRSDMVDFQKHGKYHFNGFHSKKRKANLISAEVAPLAACQMESDADNFLRASLNFKRQTLRPSRAFRFTEESDIETDGSLSAAPSPYTEAQRQDISPIVPLAVELLLIRLQTQRPKQVADPRADLPAKNPSVKTWIAQFLLNQGVLKPHDENAIWVSRLRMASFSLPGDSMKLHFVPQPSIRLRRFDSIVSIDVSAQLESLKLGLQPLSGPKDITVCYAVDGAMVDTASFWLESFCYFYQVGGFGNIALARAPGVEKGVCRWDQLPASLTSTQSLAILLPTSLATTRLMHIVSVLHRTARLHFVTSSTKAVDLLRMAVAVYSQHPVTSKAAPVNLLTPPSSPAPNELITRQPSPVTPLPAFMLRDFRAACPTQLSLEWPSPSHNVLDRHRILHVSYKPVAVDTLAVLVLDDCAEGYELWLEDLDVCSSISVVERVWARTIRQANLASVEWRLVIELIQSPSSAELEAWNVLLTRQLSSLSKPLHVSLCVVLQPATALLWMETSKVDAETENFNFEEEEAVQQHHFNKTTDYLAHATYHYHPDQLGYLFTFAHSTVYLSKLDDIQKDSLQPPAFTLHLLHTAHTASSLLGISINRHLQKLTQSLIDMFHFGSARHASLASCRLPWHLALLQCLSSNWSSLSDFSMQLPLNKQPLQPV